MRWIAAIVVYLALKIIVREVRVIEAFYTSKPAFSHKVLLTKMLCVVYSSEHCP